MKPSIVEEIGEYPYQFFLDQLEKQEYNNDIILDIIDVFSSIYFKDIMKSKKNGNARNITLEIPVTDVQLWNECKLHLEDLVNFVSGDNLEIEFYFEEKKLYPQLTLFNSRDNDFKTNTLISGGLDSFSGSFHNIENNIKSSYTGYTINKFEKSKQKKVIEFIKFKTQTKIKLFKKIPAGEKKHATQRTRSLLFLSLAVANSHSQGINNIRIYENGILSLNPSFSRRLTTKTTHPKTLYLFNKILEKLQVDINVKNPFVFKTKGNIINKMNVQFKEKIRDTYTCGRSRKNIHVKDKKKHCGYCIPCILRKISLSSFDLEDYDVEYNIGYGTKLSDIEEEYIREGYKSAVEYFLTYKRKIDKREIFQELNLKSEYYKEDNYLNLTKEMFDEFSKEVERYWDKYEIY